MAITEPDGFEQPVERLRTGGPRRPVAVALAIAVVLVSVIWQPWGRTATAIRPSTEPASPPAGIVTPPTAGPQVSAAYISLTDNEWTVVALLASPTPGSTEEPATQHGASWSAEGPFAVLQQGANVASGPASRNGVPTPPCLTTLPPRYRPAVLLPADRVAYVGVTFPGMDPATRVTASAVGGGLTLLRAAPLVIRLAGRPAGQRYIVPSTGPGGAVLFAAFPAAILPPGAYRFDVALPGLPAYRSLFACIVA